MIGYDLSSNNTTAQFETALTSSFMIVKATQGTGYTFTGRDAWIAKARAAGVLVGHYHFAWPPTSDPVAQARYFVSAAKPQPGEILALDLEANSWTADDAKAAGPFALAFRDEVRNLTGATPWFYTNASFGAAVAKATPAVTSMPLWKAYYQSTPGDLMGWPAVTCWQKTSTPIDTNEFFGDAALWRSLGVPAPQPKEPAVRLIRVTTTGAISAVTDYTFTPIATMTRANALAKVYGAWVEVTQAEADELQAQTAQNAKALPAAAPPVAPPTAAEIATAVLDEDHRRSAS